ncbi:MAG TPA: hypothetical protein VJ208_01895 [Candidatus Nanoarchaeia archaeon]|nr:hypothetical protein [Candidatus Nanoarchaeia archaeon]
MANIVDLSEWKKGKFLDSLIPKPFGNLDEFLGYCELHSKMEIAKFSVHHIYALYKMAGYSDEEFPKPLENDRSVCFLHYETLKPILGIIERRRNSLEVKFEVFD